MKVAQVEKNRNPAKSSWISGFRCKLARPNAQQAEQRLKVHSPSLSEASSPTQALQIRVQLKDAPGASQQGKTATAERSTLMTWPPAETGDVFSPYLSAVSNFTLLWEMTEEGPHLPDKGKEPFEFTLGSYGC